MALLVGVVAAPMVFRAVAVLEEDLVRLGVATNAAQAEIQHLWASMIGLGAAAAVGGLTLAFFVVRSIVIRPILSLQRVADDILKKGDLTLLPDVSSRDEFGDLATSFSAMLERLREIPMGIRESTKRLVASVAKLGASAGQQSDTVKRQAAALQETLVTAQEIRQTSVLAAQKAEAVLEYAERAESISRTGEIAVSQSLSALRDIRAQVVEIAQRITSLAERTIKIGQVTQTVKDLADQSNMLALNAAIEAVRSGEHGKGFGVVAREIRTLADQSIQATKQAREMLEDISEAIRGAVTITEKGSARIDAGLEQVKTSGEKLSELSNIVKDNSQAVRQINAAVGQQNEGIAQLFRAVTDQGGLMTDAMQRLEATDDAVKTISQASQSLLHVIEQFRA
jgi:methyl-accepting chemotaxis protein